MAKERLAAKNPVYLGDSINDQLASEAAGMPFLSLKAGLKTDFYIKNVNDLLLLLKNKSKVLNDVSFK